MSLQTLTPGWQTGFEIWPTSVNMGPTAARTQAFHAKSGETGPAGVVFSLNSGAVGSINASSGLYTGPGSVSAPTTDQVIATATDGSQAFALVFLT